MRLQTICRDKYIYWERFIWYKAHTDNKLIKYISYNTTWFTVFHNKTSQRTKWLIKDRCNDLHT